VSDRVTTHPVVLRRLQVLRVGDLGPRMRRITLGGPELDAFERDGRILPAFRTDAPDDHVRAFFPAPGVRPDDVRLPVQAGDRLEWPDDDAIPFRYYTVRRFAEGELDIDIVLHGEGRPSAWAAQAQPGMSLHLAGPRTSVHGPASSAVVLVGDEAALPAIARWAEEAPAGTSVTVVVEVHDAEDEQTLRRPAGPVDITWAHRSAGERAIDVVRRLPALDGDVFVFVAGEQAMVAEIRRHLRERGLAASQCRSATYWRASAHAEDDDDDA
jgi:NADPH-dependent ferric siderophore reductase